MTTQMSMWQSYAGYHFTVAWRYFRINLDIFDRPLHILSHQDCFPEFVKAAVSCALACASRVRRFARADSWLVMIAVARNTDNAT